MPESTDEQYVRKLFSELYGVTLRKVREGTSKTFDFEVLSAGGERVAAAEVKTLKRTPHDEANGWVRTDDGFMTRSMDNGPNRIADAIHRASKQLAGVTEPKVLVLVNDEEMMDFLSLHEAVKGYLVYGDGNHAFKNHLPQTQARDRIHEEKFQVDLYVWINRHQEVRRSWRVDGKPLEAHAERGPHIACTSQAGYAVARQYFGLPECPKPEDDPDRELPDLAGMLRREAGIVKK